MLALKPTDGNHWIICIVVHFYCHRWLRLSGSNLRSGDKECNYFPKMQMGSFESIGCESSYFSPPSKIQWNFISCYSSQRNEFPKLLAQGSDIRHWRDCSANITGAIIEAASICLFSILASNGESVKGRNRGLGNVSLCVSVEVSGVLQSRAHYAWQLRWHTHFGVLTVTYFCRLLAVSQLRQACHNQLLFSHNFCEDGTMCKVRISLSTPLNFNISHFQVFGY